MAAAANLERIWTQSAARDIAERERAAEERARRQVDVLEIHVHAHRVLEGGGPARAPEQRLAASKASVTCSNSRSRE